ncbi:MAG: hypothetical protein A2498_08875 [Lentisphaerae bacterium RIFOXYC12_FULL_60_16]|nr:MAG: hypothetical protein A2498_08875 [Lentisphaerae bacterium RIFOXYC12_FULL_60_16]OGV81035.1 MAG: hypothetical protein A2340_07240 [Lentisphaerae bacterium RIFOXYB12_FULL_60_10]
MATIRNDASLIGKEGNWALKARYGKPGVRMDLEYLRLFTREMDSLISEMSALHRSLSRRPLEHFTSEQHDRVEQMLFRFVVCWESLWDLVTFYSDFGDKVGDSSLADKGFLIGYDAALHLNYYGCKMVLTFLDEPAFTAKLNEGYPRCEIPSGTFDRMVQSVTSLDNIESMEIAWQVFKEQSEDSRSRLARVARRDTDARALVADIRRIRLYQEAQVERLLQARSILFPGMENRIRHSKIVAAIDNLRKDGADLLFKVAGTLGNGIVILTKSPLASPIELTREQIDQTLKALRPGDVLLMFSKGYMTNVFIPGRFKHALTYVGTSGQRIGLGIHTYASGYDENKLKRVMQTLARFDLTPGTEPDLVEAVGEGVIFNSLRQVLEHKVCRLVVFRPLLDAEGLSRYLSTVFSFLGAGYDFRFDFSEAEHLCCTELTYRALNGVGPIRFDLSPRMGRMTLSADDIVHQHFKTPRESRGMAVVLLAEPDPEQSGDAGRILTDDAAASRLAEIIN